ncbi:MAG: ATP-grasp domain-containing protein [Clostridium sp.]
MNFIFISPNFPESYWLFCQGLKNNGVTVLAIADTSYDSLSLNLKNSIHDFYQVSNLENYDEVFKAVAWFTYKYGKIDWIESNNEYWLRQDTRLRQDFHVLNGISYDDLDYCQRKHCMKECFKQARIKTARWQLATTLKDALEFVSLVGYPIVIKPDIGVGASDTHKIKNEEELTSFFEKGLKEEMIMEEFIEGSCFSFDGITNSKKEILFTSSHQYTDSLMDVVNEQKGIGCYSYKDIPEDIIEIGTRAVQAFPSAQRFFHFEFFRLTKDQPIGKANEIIGLEVNMRPPGGFLPDMIDYANDCNVYQLWANMIVHDTVQYKQERKYSSGFVGRRDRLTYQHTMQEIKDLYREHVLLIQRMPKALASAMGDEIIVARFKTESEIQDFFRFVQE